MKNMSGARATNATETTTIYFYKIKSEKKKSGLKNINSHLKLSKCRPHQNPDCILSNNPQSEDLGLHKALHGCNSSLM